MPSRYGILILVLEAIGATTTFIYGLNHLFYTVNEDVVKQPMLPLRTGDSYHIRVLVPCYKESIQILQVHISPLPSAPRMRSTRDVSDLRSKLC